MRCDSEHLPQFTFVRVTRIFSFSFTFTVNFTSYPPKATNSSLVFQQIFCIFIIVSCIFYGIITLLSCSKSCIVYIFYFIFELSGIISCIFPCYLFNIIIFSYFFEFAIYFSARWRYNVYVWVCDFGRIAMFLRYNTVYYIISDNFAKQVLREANSERTLSL